MISRLTLVFALFLAINLAFVSPAYSRGGGGGGGGCFAAGTLVLTPTGEKRIEQLHSGDEVIGYSFSKQQQALGKIGKIDIIQADSYYELNQHTLVTATHPFYRQTSSRIELATVRELKVGDRLLREDDTVTKVNSIAKTAQLIEVYNLLDIEPNHNFYANGFLVHNKGGSGGGGFGGHGGSYEEVKLNPGFFLSLLILCGCMLLLAHLPEIANYINYFNKEFTSNEDLITFAQQINPKFTNKYSSYYSFDDQVWKKVEHITELSEAQYQHLISKTELTEATDELFRQYQHHWTVKDFKAMKEYVTEPFYSIQEKIFQQTIGIDFDIVYNPQLEKIVPIDLESTNDKNFIRLLVSGSMVNFKLSATTGNVLSGTSQPRYFSEYWDIEIRKKTSWDVTTQSQAKFFLANITQVTDLG